MTGSVAFQIDDDDIPAVRRCLAHLAEIGYTENMVRERLGLRDINDLQLRALPIYRDERLSARTPLDIAIDLLFLQGSINPDELRRLFDEGTQNTLIRAGFLGSEPSGAVRARISLYPVGNRLVFSDHAWPQLSTPGSSSVAYDQVMFVGTDSRWLTRATIRRPVAATLDLCTGSGVQALLAATHSERVLAVDINPRAAGCTTLNAKLMDLPNLETAVGDLYAPVGQRRFDLITANPPFVPSPVDGIGFRDGGRSGEEIQRRIVAGLPVHLAPGGVAQLVTEFGERDGEPITNRIRGWLAGAPLDIHLLRLRTHSVAAYAIGHAAGDDHETFLQSVGAWATNLKEQGFVRVVSVLVAFQWSAPPCPSPWSREDEARPPTRDAGAEIAAIFAAERLSRDPGLRDKLTGSRLSRTGPVTLLEERVLGGNLPPTCQATRMGQAMFLDHLLNPLERDLLECMDAPVEMTSLLAIARQAGMAEEVLYGNLQSLLRKGLVQIMG